MTELRKGDKVSVTGTVKYTPDAGERVFVIIDGSHEELWCAQTAVKLVQAKFEVGDRVCWGMTASDGAGMATTGEILAISGEHAWIEHSNGEYCTRHFGSITRLPDEEPNVAEAGA